MLQEIVGALVRAQVGDLKRRTTGAMLEGVALGLAGLATVFLFFGAHLWLSTRMEPWLSALLLAALALFAALVVMLAGRSLLRRKHRVETDEITGTLRRLGVLSEGSPRERRTKAPANASADEPGAGSADEPGAGTATVAAALAAGIVLGRSLKR